MAESYATNQWYNLQGGVAGPNALPGPAGLSRTPKDNPEFLFPGKVRKNLGNGSDQIVQRGFIRSLLSEIPGVGESIPNRRFFFQFNPERIMRTVSVASGLMNPLLQDPGQFSVATPGNATFSFDIMLNREMEVNNATVGMDDPDKPSYIKTTHDVLGRSYTTSTKAPAQPKDVGELGVLADLMVMDSIIGQGISDDVINALSQITSKSSSWDTADTSSGASVNGFISEEKATKAFQAIKGNSAFLVSTPIRIVFSSMFMIDGFIQGSSVNFTKFNTNMVPTVCGINVTVEAKYIGFAQKDTYLTETLRAASYAPDAGTTPIPESVKGPEYDLLVAAVNDSGQYQIAIGGTDLEQHGEGWGSKNKSSGATRKGLNGYTTLCRIDPLLVMVGWVDEEDDTKTKGLGKLFYEGKYKVTFRHTPRLKVWRAFQTVGEATSASVNGFTATRGELGPGTIFRNTEGQIKRDVLLLDVQIPQQEANDWSSWQKFYSYGNGRGVKAHGGSDEEQKALDNLQNIVASNARNAFSASDDFISNFYLDGDAAENVSSMKVLVDVEIDIYASIERADKKTSTVSFTFKDSFFRDDDQICWNRFIIPKSVVK